MVTTSIVSFYCTLKNVVFCAWGEWTAIMNNPLTHPHRKGVILRYLQIIHYLRPSHHFPACHDPVGPIGAPHMHAQLDLSHRQKAFFFGQEGVLLVGMDHFTRHTNRFALLERSRDQGQVDQVMVVVEENVLLEYRPVGFVRLSGFSPTSA